MDRWACDALVFRPVLRAAFSPSVHILFCPKVRQFQVCSSTQDWVCQAGSQPFDRIDTSSVLGFSTSFRRCSALVSRSYRSHTAVKYAIPFGTYHSYEYRIHGIADVDRNKHISASELSSMGLNEGLEVTVSARVSCTCFGERNEPPTRRD